MNILRNMPVDHNIINRLIEQRDNLERLIEQNTKELQQINAAIASLRGNAPNVTRYNWSEIAIAHIKERGVFLQTTEILDEVLMNTEELKDEKKKRNALVGLSVALNSLCSKGFLKKIIIHGVKGHFYGLPDWFEDNHPKKEYIANFMARYGKATQPLNLNIEDFGTPGAGLI